MAGGNTGDVKAPRKGVANQLHYADGPGYVLSLIGNPPPTWELYMRLTFILFGNASWSMATPMLILLLHLVFKDYSHETMLRLMVETAIHWMRIGLPLKVLKIVIFARYENEIEENPLLPYFADLKRKWMKIFEREQAQPKVSRTSVLLGVYLGSIAVHFIYILI